MVATSEQKPCKDEILVEIISVYIIGNAFDLLDDLRKKRNAVSVTGVMQVGKIVWVC